MNRFITSMFFLLMAGCSTISSFQYPPVRWLRDTDTAAIPMPHVKVAHSRQPSQFGQLFSQAQDVLMFAQDVVSMPSGWVLAGKLESVDVNNFDEVADSSWFTNRIGRTGVFENTFKTPPSLKGKWAVLAASRTRDEDELVIRDSSSNHYVIKIDKHPEWLVSGGEMLGALILSAAGYNVTENYILEFDSRILDKDVLPAGKYRALAVRIPAGVQLGHFEFQGRRRDDPNDRISHEYRRELCGLKVFAALLNSKDFSTNNTLDVYDGGYVTHYLSNLTGSLANMRSEFLSGASKSDGHTIDALFSFGLYNPYWTSSDAPIMETKGVLSSEKFNPKKWRPDNPNLAFKYMSNRDAFWASRILRQFTDADIRAIVAMSGYRDSQTSDRVTAEIIARRDRIVAYWFQKVNPLDNFRIGNSLEFDDIGVPPGTRYRYRLGHASAKAFGAWRETTTLSIPLPSDIQDTVVVQIQTVRDPKKESWSPSVDVYLNRGSAILGILRRYHY